MAEFGDKFWYLVWDMLEQLSIDNFVNRPFENVFCAVECWMHGGWIIFETVAVEPNAMHGLHQ